MDWQDLLDQKNFDELSENEKQVVLQHCSAEAYQLQRQAILASQALWTAEMQELEVPAPNRAILDTLKEKRLLLKESKVVVVPWWQQWVNYSIPIWKVAAAALLFLCLQQALPTTNSIAPVTALMQRDTVYLERYHTTIEKVLQPADTIIKVVYRTIDTVTTVIQPVLAGVSDRYEGSYQEEEVVAQVEPIDLWKPTYNHTGQSLNQDTFLQELTNQVVSDNVFTSSAW
ncbi:MAG: hypothetical protein AB8E82_01805 [Aureispira sp.]